MPFIFSIKAQKFLTEGNFDIVFTTHNYKIKGDELRITVPKQERHLRKFLFEPSIRLNSRDTS